MVSKSLKLIEWPNTLASLGHIFWITTKSKTIKRRNLHFNKAAKVLKGLDRNLNKIFIFAIRFRDVALR